MKKRCDHFVSTPKVKFLQNISKINILHSTFKNLQRCHKIWTPPILEKHSLITYSTYATHSHISLQLTLSLTHTFSPNCFAQIFYLFLSTLSHDVLRCESWLVFVRNDFYRRALKSRQELSKVAAYRLI